jgi:hypothetical protein
VRQLEGALVPAQVRIALAEAAAAIGAPAVQRQPVLPDADVQAALADDVRRHAVGQDDVGVRVLLEDQRVQPVEQRPAPRAMPSM